jgi:hypothetical protein
MRSKKLPGPALHEIPQRQKNNEHRNANQKRCGTQGGETLSNHNDTAKEHNCPQKGISN